MMGVNLNKVLTSFKEDPEKFRVKRVELYNLLDNPDKTKLEIDARAISLCASSLNNSQKVLSTPSQEYAVDLGVLYYGEGSVYSKLSKRVIYYNGAHAPIYHRTFNNTVKYIYNLENPDKTALEGFKKSLWVFKSSSKYHDILVELQHWHTDPF